MGYNYNLIIFTEIKRDDVLIFKDKIESSIEFENDEYKDAFKVDVEVPTPKLGSKRVTGYLFQEKDDSWYFGLSFMHQKDTECTSASDLMRIIPELINQLGYVLKRSIHPKKVFIKYGSEGNPLVVY